MTKSVAIYSNYKHHAKTSGYKQILNFTKPVATFGINYHVKNSRFELSYFYVHEFIAWFKTFGVKFSVLHILYAEEYFRFSHLLFFRKRIVLTFHQPPDILKQELESGNFNGRVAAITHKLLINRFRKISAAIVTSPSQKEVLKNYIPEYKIHIIPLGVDLSVCNSLYAKHKSKPRQLNVFLTVGEWQRDWDLYVKVVNYCLTHCPELKFILVNNRLSEAYITKLKALSNVDYLSDVTDEELYALYVDATALFLPLKGAAGNNALNESLALGCPLVSNIAFTQFKQYDKFTYLFGEINEIEKICKQLNSLSETERLAMSEKANQSVQEMSWERIAQRTMQVYDSVC